MWAWEPLGQVLMVLGGALLLVGLLLILGERIPWLGRLPGDVHLQRGGVTVELPAVTCLVISLVLTLVVNLLLRLFRR